MPLEPEEPATRFPQPKASDSRPYLTLVDRDKLSNMGNIPRNIWEPMSLLYDEADAARHRVNKMEIPGELEALRGQILEKWGRVLGWLDEILLKSQSVNALRSWQMVQSFQAQNDQARAPLIGLAPQAPNQEPERRRGLGLRKR